MGKIPLRRYTSLPVAIHILQSHSLTLLSPMLWDDRNDKHYMNSYMLRKKAKSVLALCFAEAAETYHHWHVFSRGSDGVCIEFDKERLTSAFRSHPHIQARSVDYRKIDELKSAPPTDELPFLKRYPFQDEREFRIVYTDDKELVDAKEFEMPLSTIGRIYLSPWMPKVLSKSVIKTLRSIEGCSKLKVYRSTLVENERWKSAIGPDRPDGH